MKNNQRRDESPRVATEQERSSAGGVAIQAGVLACVERAGNPASEAEASRAERSAASEALWRQQTTHQPEWRNEASALIKEKGDV